MASAITGVLLTAILVARSPRFTAPLAHTVYGGSLSWWYFCMSLMAVAESPERAALWARIGHLGFGVLPAAIYHLNLSTAGLVREHTLAVRVHYAAAAAVTLLCVATPWVLIEPRMFAWGWYPAYSAWGLVPAGFLVVAIGESLWTYRRALREATPGTAHHETLRTVHRFNGVASLALVDTLPLYGIAVYPFAYALLTALQALNLYGSLRDRLIEITPEFAAEPILRTLPDGVFAVDSSGHIRFANEAAASMLGTAVQDLIDRPLRDAVESPRLREALEVSAADPVQAREVELPSADDRPGVARISGALLRVKENAPLARIWVLHDLTGQRRAEAEAERLEGWVRRGQKLETLGVMAGGIAHDFNNLLTSIMGSADVARSMLPRDHPVYENLDAIDTATDRAAELTGQMLAYAGRGTSTRRALDLNEICDDMAELIRTAVSRKAVLEVELGDDLPPVVADPSQMSQVVMNLLTNASEALTDGPGRISLRTGVLNGADEKLDAFDPDIPHVFIEVSDTGCGIPPETRSRIFDPFFTTKFTGRGLGLATVMGIVESHGGRLRVDSEPGHGTRFTVALPADPTARIERSRDPGEASEWQGHGLVLLADDEPSVRLVVRRMLDRAGYEVVEAPNGKDAVALFGERRDEIVLALLDTTMPEMDGLEVLDRIRAVSPELPVILMSGYEPDGIRDLESDPSATFLQKPFHVADLVATLRAATGDPRPGQGSNGAS